MVELLVQAVWGDRRESAVDCAVRLRGFLADLYVIDPTFGGWIDPRNRRIRPLPEVGLDLASLTKLFEVGRNHREDNHEVIEELGFHIVIRNQGEPFSVELSVHAGEFDSWDSGLYNIIVFELEGEEDRLGAALSLERVRRLFEAIVRWWELEFVRLVSDEWMIALEDAGFRSSHAGWLTWVGPGRPVGALPDGVQSVPLAGGQLVMIGEDVWAVTSEQVVSVQVALDAAGTFAPTP